MIEVKNISVSLSGKKIIKDLSFTIQKGDKLAILGPSGEGKSVLIRTLLGLIRPDKGRVIIDGIDVHNSSGTALMNLRKKVGILFQNSALFDFMNVEQNITFGVTVHDNIPEAVKREKVNKMLKMFDMEGINRQFPDELSGGMQKRVALARAVIREPEFIFYDEPTSGLDPVRARHINEYIGDLHKNLGITSVIITHDMVSLDKVADKILLIKKSKIVFYDNVSKIKNNLEVMNFVQGVGIED